MEEISLPSKGSFHPHSSLEPKGQDIGKLHSPACDRDLYPPSLFNYAMPAGPRCHGGHSWSKILPGHYAGYADRSRDRRPVDPGVCHLCVRRDHVLLGTTAQQDPPPFNGGCVEERPEKPSGIVAEARRWKRHSLAWYLDLMLKRICQYECALPFVKYVQWFNKYW